MTDFPIVVWPATALVVLVTVTASCAVRSTAPPRHFDTPVCNPPVVSSGGIRKPESPDSIRAFLAASPVAGLAVDSSGTPPNPRFQPTDLMRVGEATPRATGIERWEQDWWLVVDTAGTVIDARMTRSVGNPRSNPRALTRALRSLSFEPAKLGDCRVFSLFAMRFSR